VVDVLTPVSLPAMGESFPPVAPSDHVGLRHPLLRSFLERQVDMQITDLRLLLRLPIEELGSHLGANLTTAAVTLNLISGFSVWFYRTDKALKIEGDEQDGRRRSKQRFLGFVNEYWPQLSPEPPSPESTAAVLYEVRCSLSHDLGATDNDASSAPRNIRLAKHPLTHEEIVVLERSATHPLNVPVVEDQGDVCTVHLTGLYWALHRMLKAALTDKPDELEAAIGALHLPELAEADDEDVAESADSHG